MLSFENITQAIDAWLNRVFNPATATLLEGILADEEEHADDLVDLLAP